MAPIWLPHWPAWMWTISLIFTCCDTLCKCNVTLKQADDNYVWLPCRIRGSALFKNHSFRNASCRQPTSTYFTLFYTQSTIMCLILRRTEFVCDTSIVYRRNTVEIRRRTRPFSSPAESCTAFNVGFTHVSKMGLQLPPVTSVGTYKGSY